MSDEVRRKKTNRITRIDPLSKVSTTSSRARIFLKNNMQHLRGIGALFFNYSTLKNIDVTVLVKFDLGGLL